MHSADAQTAQALVEPLTGERACELFSQTYNCDGPPDWSHILPYYHENVVFQDSIQRTEGIDAFTELCNHITGRCRQLHMDIISVAESPRKIFLEWKVAMVDTSWPKSPVSGCSILTLNDDGKIIRQRDYYDLWGDIIDGMPRFSRLYRRFMRKYFGSG